MIPVSPSDNLILDKSTRRCKPKKLTRTGLPRCPTGSRRDKKTLKYVKNTAKPKVVTRKKPTTKKSATKKSAIKKSATKKSATKKPAIKKSATKKSARPNRTRKVKLVIVNKPADQKPGGATRPTRKPAAQAHTVIKGSSPKRPIVVATSTTPDDKAISKAVAVLVQDGAITPVPKLLSKADQNRIMADIRGELIVQRSFSPAVNQRLVTMRPGKQTDIFGCGAEDVLKRTPMMPMLGVSGLQVKVGTDSDGKAICMPWQTKRAQRVLLDNLRTEGTIDCRKVVAPMQALSNCWFNTMFMTLFVSDKGRKFFRFFRQLMIEGKLANGTKINPPKLAQAFFLFNAAIEASLDPSKEMGGTNLASLMNTNNLINAIYAGMPAKARKLYGSLVQMGKSNNPLAYYFDIIHYLYSGIDTLPRDKDLIMLKMDVRALMKLKKVGRTASLPDIIVVTIHDGNSEAKKGEKLPGKSGRFKDRPRSFTIKPSKMLTLEGEFKYVLDSAIIRDTEAQHFCSLLTCGGKEMGFDGESFSRITNMDWKHLINTDQEWTFEGSLWQGSKDSIKWNFRNGYQLLFYYRES